MNRRKAQKHKRFVAVQDEKGKVHNDQGQQCFSLIHMHAYARTISVQSRRAEERQTNLACMMMDSSGCRPDLCSHGKQACIWDTRIQKG
jgi:hypothetical protein